MRSKFFKPGWKTVIGIFLFSLTLNSCEDLAADFDTPQTSSEKLECMECSKESSHSCFFEECECTTPGMEGVACEDDLDCITACRTEVCVEVADCSE
jgi:hypothetical protein